MVGLPDGRPEVGHESVAQILVERTAVGEDRIDGALEEAVQQGHDPGRRQRFGERSEVAQIAEEDGHLTRFAARGQLGVLGELRRYLWSEVALESLAVALLGGNAVEQRCAAAARVHEHDADQHHGQARHHRDARVPTPAARHQHQLADGGDHRGDGQAPAIERERREHEEAGIVEPRMGD